MEIVYNTMSTDTYIVDFVGSPIFGESEINTTFTAELIQTSETLNTLDPSAEIVYNVLL